MEAPNIPPATVPQPVLVQAVREAANETSDPQLLQVMMEYDRLKAAGKNVEIRVDGPNKRIRVVELEEVEVTLGDLMEQELKPAYVEDYEDGKSVLGEEGESVFEDPGTEQ